VIRNPEFGLQMVGRRFQDGRLLKAAAAFEQILPWADRTPPLS
jgi:Asp-tRNA(Asn)/Glu-tRNA(Gln) amidotransferase A subunit family amidase